MKDTVRLGRLGGVPVGLNWSLIVVAGFLAFVLADSRLPLDAPGYASAAYAVTGVLTAVGLLVTVLAHELGHAVVARRCHLRVDGITLSWVGGITRIEGESATPAVEAAVAGVGPLVSLVAGGALWSVRLGLLHAGAGHLVAAALGWLAVINVVLAVFNLLPAAPLDGGRILHAIAWRITRSRWRAGRLASLSGVAFGALVVVAGGWEAATGHGAGDTFDALVTGLLGWWLIAAARMEGQLASLHRALDGASCCDLMRPVAAGSGWLSVEQFLAQAEPERSGPVWMLEGWDGTYTGLVTSEALLDVPVDLRPHVRATDVGVSIGDAAGAHPHDEVIATLSAGNGARVILVVDDGHTVGAILPSDIDDVVHRGHRPVPLRAQPTGAGVR